MTKARELQALIQATPACAEAAAANNDAAVALALKGLRKRLVSRSCGEGAISTALGFPGGPAFCAGLKAVAEDTSEADQQTLAFRAVCAQVFRLLQTASLDMGLPMVRQNIGIFVLAGLLTEEQVAALLALAEVDDDPTPQEVSLALRGPWGDE